MTIEEIRKGAPREATHYHIMHKKVTYHKKKGLFWVDVTDNGYILSSYKCFNLIKPL